MTWNRLMLIIVVIGAIWMYGGELMQTGTEAAEQPTMAEVIEAQEGQVMVMLATSTEATANSVADTAAVVGEEAACQQVEHSVATITVCATE